MIKINSAFSAGNILVESTSAQKVQLSIKADNQSEFKQWFYFKANAERGTLGQFEIIEADKCAYPDGWKDYNVCCSYDGEEWFRIPTQYNEGTLSFELEFEHPSAFFAYFAPYSYERHMQLVHQVQTHDLCKHKVLGETLDGRELNLLVVGNEKAANKVWITARQHPGESMAEWLMEGLIFRLLNQDDVLSRRLLDNACFYLVPNMNPDGTERGHLRTNAIGVNLNREWNKSSLEKSPEVFHVVEAMKRSGVDLYIDVHGDEGLPYNFVAASEGIPSYSQAMANQEKAFISAFLGATPEFQNEFGYPKDEAGKADLSIASSWVAEEFKCLALTLEMPFKDNANLPDESTGWSPQRSMLLGEALLIPINQCLPD